LFENKTGLIFCACETLKHSNYSLKIRPVLFFVCCKLFVTSQASASQQASQPASLNSGDVEKEVVEDKKDARGEEKKKKKEKEKKGVATKAQGTSKSMLDEEDSSAKAGKKLMQKKETEELCAKQITSREVGSAYIKWGVHKEGVQEADKKMDTLWKLQIHVAFIEYVSLIFFP